MGENIRALLQAVGGDYLIKSTEGEFYIVKTVLGTPEPGQLVLDPTEHIETFKVSDDGRYSVHWIVVATFSSLRES